MSNSVDFNEIQDKLLAAVIAAQDAVKSFRGRKIKITDNYNGQVYGSSKKNLKGTIQEVNHVYVTETGLYVSIDHPACGLLLESTQFEFLD